MAVILGLLQTMPAALATHESESASYGDCASVQAPDICARETHAEQTRCEEGHEGYNWTEITIRPPGSVVLQITGWQGCYPALHDEPTATEGVSILVLVERDGLIVYHTVSWYDWQRPSNSTYFRWEGRTGSANPGPLLPTQVNHQFEWTEERWGDESSCEMDARVIGVHVPSDACLVGAPPPPPSRPWGHMFECEDAFVGERDVDAFVCFARSEAPRVLADGASYAGWAVDRAGELLP